MRYSPVTTYHGADSFTYVAHDGAADSAPATVSIQIKPGNTQVCTGPDEDGDGLLDPACTQPFTPPDPRTVAPPNDPTVSTGLLTSFEFLTGGAQPIQRGVTQDTIQAKTAAVLRGRVLDGDGRPLRGALVRVSGRPEFGYTYSRADGYYDLLVNGGGTLHLDFQADGYIRAQRPADAPWQDFAHVDDVALVRLDPNATQVSFSAVSPPQVVRGSEVGDADGQRQATMFIPAATEALIELHDGTTRPVSSLTLRATEFTLGDDGLARMPGALPTSSGYTYAVELSADEAIAANAKSVRFTKPAAFYLDNFLDLPVGLPVPVGYYDYARSTWHASDNGRIVKIIGNEAGRAMLDVKGQGAPATPDELRELGIDDTERAAMIQTYGVGQELWRAPIAHLTPWDLNYPVKVPDDAISPESTDPESELDKDDEEPEEECGSVIGCQNASLSEIIPIAGTPYELVYHSDRAEGTTAYRKTRVKLTGATLPSSLKALTLTWQVAGQKRVQRIESPAVGAVFDFEWNGRDVFGRDMFGAHRLSVDVAFDYGAVYTEPADALQSFGLLSNTGTVVSTNRERAEISLTRRSTAELRAKAVDPASLGGFRIGDQHAFDMRAGAMDKGIGGRQAAAGMPKVGRRVVGIYGNVNAQANISGGMRLSDVKLPSSQYNNDIEVLADGSIAYADAWNRTVWKLGANGFVHHVLGKPSNGGSLPSNCAEIQSCIQSVQGVATETWMRAPIDMAVGTNGCLFVATTEYVLRVCNGIVALVWKAPPPYEITSIALSRDSRLFVAASNGSAVYQIEPYPAAGTAEITSRRRVAGAAYVFGSPAPIGYSGNGGPATSAKIQANKLRVGPDGFVYLSEPYVIRRIESDGTISRVIGRPAPQCDSTLDGCRATSVIGSRAIDSKLAQAWSEIVFLRNGDLLFTDGPLSNRGMIRRIDALGIVRGVREGSGTSFINCVASPLSPGCTIDTPDPQYRVGILTDIEVDHDGSLLALDTEFRAIHRLTKPLPTYSVAALTLPSKSGNTAAEFDDLGRHLKTRDTFTGAVLRSFDYDSNGRLVGISDADGRRTTIERDANGVPRALVAPHGQRTELELDAQGHLAAVRDPLRNEHRMAYRAGGLLESFSRPGTAPSTMTYAPDGRLSTDVNPLGGGWTLDRTEIEGGRRVELTSFEGHRQSYESKTLSTGEKVRTTQDRDGSVRTRVQFADGGSTHVLADGSEVKAAIAPDPRFGVVAPITTTTLKLPSGRTLKSIGARTVTLSDPSNPFSLQSWLETKSVNGRVYKTQYDATTRMLTATSPMNRTRSAVLDAKGKPLSMSFPGLASVSYQYDTEGRIETITQTADGRTRTTRLGYDAHGFVASLTDPARRTVGLTNNAVGETKTKTLPDTREIGFERDARGNVTGITPPGRPTHVFGYDDLDQLGGYAPPTVTGGGTGLTDYAYNRDRQLERVARPDGAVLDPQYDAATGKLRTLVTPEGSTAYAWLPGGRIDTIAAPGGHALDYDYDGSLLTRVVSTGAAPGTVGYTYDSNLWLDTVNTAGTLVDYGYDTDGLLTSAKVGANTVTLTRNAQHGLLEGMTLGQATDAWSYNAFAEPLSYSARYGTATQFSAAYTRDDLGRINTRSETTLGDTRSEVYGYDLAGRLETVHRGGALVSDYQFDDNSNRREHKIGPASPLRGKTLPCLGDLSGTNEIAVRGHYDAQDRMTAYGSCTFRYTANGELEQRSDTATGAITTYRYDVFGNLRTATLPNQIRIDYDIDGNNRRVAKRVNGTQVQGFLYLNHLEPIAELDGSGNVVATFVYADRAHTPSLMLKGGKTYRIVADHVGSVRLIVDIATGDVAQRMEYDEYGNVVVDTNPGFQPFGYAGGIYDRDLGFVRFGARDYDPLCGRWASKDSARMTAGDSNLYDYVFLDPMNRIDSDGHQAIVIPVAGTMASSNPLLLRTNPLTQAIRIGLQNQRAPRPSPIEQALSDLGFPPRQTGQLKPGTQEPWMPPEIKTSAWRNADDMLEAIKLIFEALKNLHGSTAGAAPECLDKLSEEELYELLQECMQRGCII